VADDVFSALVLTYGFDASYLTVAYVVSRLVYLVVIVGLLIAMYRFLHR